MKKKVLLFLCLFIVFIPFSLYFFSEEVSLYHPYELRYKDDKENELYTLIRDRPAQYIEYKDISPLFIKYLLAIEDASFFSHPGFDIGRIFSSLFHNLFSNDSIQGASTITMQLARLLYLNQERSIQRKIQEFFLAQKIERKLSKEKILEYYLNSIYFAHGIYGIATASSYYFNKKVNELNTYEMAMLIGIINAPNSYSPYIDLVKSKEKTKQILRTLVNKKVLTVKDYYKAFETPFKLINHQEGITPIKSYYIDAVNEEMKRLDVINQNNLRHGLVIKTFLDQKIQRFLEEIPHKFNLGNNNLALVVMEVGTGKVLALLGGKNYEESSFNRALHAKKQIGSTIKPLLYYLALQKGFTPLTELKSEKTTFHIQDYGDYEVSNAGDIYANRKITLLEALAMSDNIYAVKTMLYIGSENLKRLIESLNFHVDVDNITLSLGSNSLTPLELTSVYNAIASGGLYYPPKFIDEIKTEDSFSLYRANPYQNRRVFLRLENSILRYLLRATFDKALKTYASPSLVNYYISPSYGGKTGSTKSSSWVIGFSPKYTIGVYVGTDDNTPMEDALLSRRIFYTIGNYLKIDDQYFKPDEELKIFHIYNSLSNLSSFPYLRR